MKRGVKTTERHRRGIIAAAACFCVVVFSLVVYMDYRSFHDQYSILEESVEHHLIATSLAARDRIDIDVFESYNSIQDIEADEKNYNETLDQLKSLADSVGAEYIYALKEIDGKYYFIFDTDPETDTRFAEYELSPVYQQAFEGRNSAALMNVDDEFGSFNSGAVPLMDGDKVVGIVGTDTSDAFIEQSLWTSTLDTITLVVVLGVALIILMVSVVVLTGRLRTAQAKLAHLALYDATTNLPNRHYLTDCLDKLTADKNKDPFALFFIDLDHFKAVNDNAGHDAGDELLRHVGEYLKNMPDNSTVFRPSAGKLNFSARIGGDEFIHIVSGISTKEEAAAVAEYLLSSFQTQKLDRFIEKYEVGLSIGVALYPYHTEDYNVLIKYADLAMYQSKRSKKNSYCIYSDEMSRERSTTEFPG